MHGSTFSSTCLDNVQISCRVCSTVTRRGSGGGGGGVKREKELLLDIILAPCVDSSFTAEVGEPPELHTRNYDTPLSDINIDKKDVTTRLSKIDPNKSPGPDGQHPRVYKELANVIDQPLCQIFRKSLQQLRHYPK